MNETGTATRWLTLDSSVRLYRSSDDGAIHVVNQCGQRFSCTAEALPLFEALRHGVRDDGSCAPGIAGLLLGLEEHHALAVAAAPPAATLDWNALPSSAESGPGIGRGAIALVGLYLATAVGVLALAMADVSLPVSRRGAGDARWLLLFVVYLPLWVFAHEHAHAAMARRVGVAGGRIQFLREGRWCPRFVTGVGAGLIEAPRRISIYLAGPALDAALTCVLAALLWLSRANVVALWLALHLGFAVFNLLPVGRCDAARALAAMATGTRRRGARRAAALLRILGFATALGVAGVLLHRLLRVLALS